MFPIHGYNDKGVSKKVLCDKFLRIQQHVCFWNQAYTSGQFASNIIYVSSMFCYLYKYLNSLVGIAHFINGTSISTATWMTIFHLGNIVNEYWYESTFPLSQTDISFIALTTNLDIFSVSSTLKKLSTFLWNRQYHLIGTKEYRKTCSILSLNIYTERGCMLLKQDKYVLMGIYRRKQWWNISCYEIALEQKSLSA